VFVSVSVSVPIIMDIPDEIGATGQFHVQMPAAQANHSVYFPGEVNNLPKQVLCAIKDQACILALESALEGYREHVIATHGEATREFNDIKPESPN